MRDIPRMSRRDNLWSWSVAYGIDVVLIQAEKKQESFTAVDIYHDPKTLTESHRKALYGVLTKHLVEMLKGGRRRGFGFGFKNLKIRRIESVEKSKTAASETKIQKGVWMADQLAKYANLKELERFTNLQVIDVTSYIQNTIKRWKDGELI